jgi:hypothetical protein
VSRISKAGRSGHQHPEAASRPISPDPRPWKGGRRALELLATSPGGCTEAMLLAQGFKHDTLATHGARRDHGAVGAAALSVCGGSGWASTGACWAPPTSVNCWEPAARERGHGSSNRPACEHPTSPTATAAMNMRDNAVTQHRFSTRRMTPPTPAQQSASRINSTVVNNALPGGEWRGSSIVSPVVIHGPSRWRRPPAAESWLVHRATERRRRQ